MSLPENTSTRLSDIDWRSALPQIALLLVTTRLLVLAVAVAVEVMHPELESAGGVGLGSIVDRLTMWDGKWFTSIAESGYHRDPLFGNDGNPYVDYAFYPFYPIVIRAVSLLTMGDTAVAGILVANVAFALALVALYALSVRYLTPARALLSLWFLALAPGAAAFTLAYADSLFLLLTVGAFLAAESRRPWIAGIALALATITRAPGLLLILPVLVLYIQRDGWRPTKAWIPLALAPLALAGFFAYTWWLTGDPIAPVSAYDYWRPPEPPGLVPASTPPDSGRDPLSLGVAILLGGTLASYVFLFVFFRHSPIRAPYWLVAILAVAGFVLAGTLVSAPRYVAGAWPFGWAFASRRSHVGQAAVLTGLAATQILFLWLHFAVGLPP